MTNRAMSRLGWGLLFALSSAGTAAEAVYKWTDAQGVTHFSAQPPADQQAEQLKVEAPPPTATPADKPQASAEKAKQKSKESTEPSAEEIAEIERKRAADCETAKRDLDTLKTRVHVRIRDEKTGEDRYLTAEEHAKRQKEAAAHIDKYCTQVDGG